ncbi:MAG: replication factor C large subunit [Nanoarchaeota archaeon]
MTLVEKHRPKKYSEIIGQKEAINSLKNFLNNFQKNKCKSLVLYGPPGIGKTTLAHVTANERNAEIFELNASDLRNKKKLQEVLKPSIEQTSLLKTSKIILVDEVDGISAVDRGGLTELLLLIKNSKFPVILTANDIWNKKFSSLRKISQLLELKDLSYKEVKELLIQILRKEKKFIDNEILSKIASSAEGDLRAALNDLETILNSDKKDETIFEKRNKEKSIFNAMRFVFKGKPLPETLNIFDSVNLSTDDIILWMEKNIPKEYSGKELVKAMDLLSKTDLFRGRIYKQQYWRFLVYENFFLSYGISAIKDKNKTNTSFTAYKKPTRILKMWMHNQQTMKKKSISEKYAEKTHVNKKRALREFPIIKEIIKSNPSVQSELRLEKDEIEYLRNR